MASSEDSILLLAGGNDLFGDDAVGLMAARLLRPEFEQSVHIEEAAVSGFELIDLLSGYGKALIMDAIHTGNVPPGTVSLLTLEEFSGVGNRSPHYAGLPDVVQIAERLEIPFPGEIKILAMEIDPPIDLRIGLSPEIEISLHEYLERARAILHGWTVPVQM